MENYLKRRLRQIYPGSKYLKVQRLRGWPDRLILLGRGGVQWYAETKRPKGGRFEPHQERIAAWLLARGYNYCLLSTRDEVDQWLRRVGL